MVDPAVDYGRGVHHLVPALVAAVCGETAPLTSALVPGGRAVALLVVDGLGARQLAAHSELAPTLTEGSRRVLHAPFPTTTVTSLTSIGTGRPPGEHGLPGYAFRLPPDPRPFFGLTWSWDAHDPDRAVVDQVRPEVVQPLPTAFERARRAGVRPVTILRDEFATSGLTRAGLRGGDVIGANGLSATLAAIRDVLVHAAGPTVVYAHHGRLDAVGHIQGPGSDAWCTELARIDGAVASLGASLPPGTALVVTGDHGMVAVPDEGCVELAETPDLMAGVGVLAGEPRARQLHTIDGAHDDVLATWREHCGQRAWVLSRDEAIAAGWFGPVVSARVRPRIGDVVVSAQVPSLAWVHRDRDLLGGRLAGQHGAATPEEVEVPMAVFNP